MRLIRSAFLALSLLGLAAACGGKDKKPATTPAPVETKPAETPVDAPANPCGGAPANPCGGAPANPCGGAADPCAGT